MSPLIMTPDLLFTHVGSWRLAFPWVWIYMVL